MLDRLREQNADGPRFGFFGGPVTANKTMGVHTAWGRTHRDVFLRYKAVRGYSPGPRGSLRRASERLGQCMD